MRRINVVLAALLCIALFCAGDAYARRKTMREFFDEKGVTKAYVSDVTNSSGDSTIDLKEVKSVIEEALRSRRSHTIEIASSQAAADIVIDVDITEYVWTDEDPVDMVFSPIAAAADAAIQDNYARMQANFTVTDAKKSKKLWKELVQSTITSATMAKEESYGLSTDRLVKNFIKKLFKKPKRR
jgi:hypothetical protein